MSVLQNRIHTKGKVRSIGLYQIPMCAHAEGALRDFAGGILTDDQYFRARTELSNSLSDFHAIQFGEFLIENDQIC